MAIRMVVRRIALNHAGDKVRALQAAVSDTSGVLKMLNAGVLSEGYFKFDAGRSATELTSVRAITIDEMASEFGVPTHIKIDVEGQEAAAFREGRQTLRVFRRRYFSNCIMRWWLPTAVILMLYWKN
jgi:FkbM family methyltransferase